MLFKKDIPFGCSLVPAVFAKLFNFPGAKHVLVRMYALEKKEVTPEMMGLVYAIVSFLSDFNILNIKAIFYLDEIHA